MYLYYKLSMVYWVSFNIKTNFFMFPIEDDTGLRFVIREFYGLVKQRFVVDHPVRFHGTISADHNFWLCELEVIQCRQYAACKCDSGREDKVKR